MKLLRVMSEVCNRDVLVDTGAQAWIAHRPFKRNVSQLMDARNSRGEISRYEVDSP